MEGKINFLAVLLVEKGVAGVITGLDKNCAICCCIFVIVYLLLICCWWC